MSRKPPPGTRPPHVAASPSPLFFCHVLQHLPVEHQRGNQALEPIGLGLELFGATGVIRHRRIVPLTPTVVGPYADAVLAADIAKRQPLGQLSIHVSQEMPNLLRVLSFAHQSLLGLSLRNCHISWTRIWAADQRGHSLPICATPDRVTRG